MAKILFIASLHLEYCGGEVCTLRNLDILKTLYGKENVIEFRISRDITFKNSFKILWYIRGFINDVSMCSIGGLDKKQIHTITNIIEKDNIEHVFLDSSTFGSLAKRIKFEFPKIKIYSFFHNIEYLYYKQEFHVQRNYFLKYRINILKKNEMDACNYSSTIIALNQRDSNIINSFYHRAVDFIIPISIKDTYKINVSSKSTIDTKQKIGLFVGSHFSLNVEGILYFIHHILPYTKIKLIIVGSGMNKLNVQLTKIPNIEIHDYTYDLNTFYDNADFAIIPILSGSGMKVKTAEALMHGKYIIGSTEAFEGYEINESIGKVCKNDADFIKAINQYNKTEKFNQPSRDLYLSSYSYEASLEKFKKVFNLN